MTKTREEVAQVSGQVRDYIKVNGTLPTLITFNNGEQVNQATFLRMMSVAIAQLQKQDYIQLAKDVNNFIKGNGYAPTLYTTRYGQLSFYDVIWTMSRVLAFYKENNYLPNYVVLENRFQNSTPTNPTALATKTITEVGKASVDVRNFIQKRRQNKWQSTTHLSTNTKTLSREY